jgi:hypothetical protein
MVLHAKAEIKGEIVAQNEFAPQLFVSLVAVHVGFAPNVGEVGEFHGLRTPRSKAADLLCQQAKGRTCSVIVEYFARFKPR